MSERITRLNTDLSDRYLIEAEVGRGGMAIVYSAADLRHGRRVALKVLSEEASVARSGSRFAAEIRVSARLTHPHIVPLFDSGEVAGSLFFVMPLVPGETLRAKLAREGQVPVNDALRIIREVAGALEYAHRAGVIHRDVKPENILLSEGHALLADFGIATVADRLTDTSTAAGAFLGTPGYVAPEQALGVEAVGPAADEFALACVLFELLTGSVPHAGPNIQATLARRLTEPAPSARVLRPDLPHSLDRALTRALDPDPARRFGGTAAFATALENGRTEPNVPGVSLVVRPFDAVGDDRAVADFADGLTEEVINDLSKVRNMRTISRTSAMRLRGSSSDARAIGREYGVRYVVSGSVRGAGSELRVTTELVDVMLDAPVWAERFSGSLEAPFRTQEQVARGIVDALHVSLSPEERRQLAARPIADARALGCYRRATTAIFEFTRDGLERAERLLRQGAEIVGENALFLTAWGSVHFQYVNAGFDSNDPARAAQRLAEARASIDRAMALDPGLPEAHIIRSWMLMSDAAPALALRHLEQALRTEPNNSHGLALKCVALWVLGRREELHRTVEHLMSIDPWEFWGIITAGVDCSLRGDREGRDRFFRRAIEISPAGMTYLLLGQVLAHDGETAAAASMWRQSRASDPADLGNALCAAGIAGLEGDPTPALRFLDQWTTSVTIARDPQWLWLVADILAIAGLHDQAIDALARAVESGFSNELMLGGRDAALHPLRDHPRFAQVLESARMLAASED